MPTKVLTIDTDTSPFPILPSNGNGEVTIVPRDNAGGTIQSINPVPEEPGIAIANPNGPNVLILNTGVHGLNPGTGISIDNSTPFFPAVIDRNAANGLAVSVAGVASGVTFADPTTAQQPATKAYVDPTVDSSVTVTTATSTILATLTLADNTIYDLIVVCRARDTGTNEAEWILSQTWRRMSGGGASQLGADRGPAPVSEISSATLTGQWLLVSPSGNIVRPVVVTSNASHVFFEFQIWFNGRPLPAAV